MEAIVAALIAAIVPFFLSLFGDHRAEKEDSQLQQAAEDLGLKDAADKIQKRRGDRLRRNSDRAENYFRILVLYVYLGLILIGGLIGVGYYWVRTSSHDPLIIWLGVIIGALIILAVTSLSYALLINFGTSNPPSGESSRGDATPLPATGARTSTTPDQSGNTPKIDKT